MAIIGGGTAGLFAAAFLDADRYEVTIYEKKASVGRKFLVAGDGGFNLTHSEEIDDFIERYTPDTFLAEALRSFSNADFIEWLHVLGIPTFIGSSKRVFPEKGIKPIEVLNKITDHLKDKNVQFKFKQEFTGWTEEGNLIFNNKDVITADYYLFALGGASWKITGSDGSWIDLFKKRGFSTHPFVAANCAYAINWPTTFLEKHEGKPLKNIALTIDNQTCKGEIVLTSFGIEGNAIYALSPKVQASLDKRNFARVYLDNKPTVSQTALMKKLRNSKFNTSRTLKEIIKLSPAQMTLIKEGLTKEEFLNHEKLASSIKKFPLKITAAGPIDEAISTTGGIALTAVSDSFELKNQKNTYVIGEMLDWNAPTGGYLIQACVSMGVAVARTLNNPD